MAKKPTDRRMGLASLQPMSMVFLLPQNKIIGCELPEHGLIHNSFGVAFVNSRLCVNSNIIRLVAVTGHREEIV